MGGTIRHFTEIKAWQFGREAIKNVYRLTNKPAFSRDFGLRDQIRRAVTSINLNIAEGFARGTDKEFHQFVIQARGSAAEVLSGLYTALDLEYITQEDFDMVAAKVDSLSRMLTKLAQYLDKPVTRRFTDS